LPVQTVKITRTAVPRVSEMREEDRMSALCREKSIDLQNKTKLTSVLPMLGIAIRNLHAASRLRAGRAFVSVLLLSLCAIPVHAGLPRAQKHERRHEIDQLEEVWRTALLKGDTSTMNSLLADDYMAITPTGTLETKDESLANLRTGTMHVTSLEISDRKVRFHGGTALVTSLADVQANTPSGPLSGAYRYTRVYVQDAQGAWKIVTFEASRIINTEDHK
jgi:ketosteroid isomerase-like protein